jgi:purine nucleosidase
MLCGGARPLARPQATQLNPATRIHGDLLDLPPTTRRADDGHAVDWLIDTYLASDGDITLGPGSPATIDAIAIQKEP